VTDVVGDRLWLTVLVSFVTIIFTWLIAFPDRHLFGHASV
jgi:peptide/nickel transport system permease protein